MSKESLFAKQLKSWYRKNARSLPWRETSDPYKIWISEIMLQQTTVAAVIPYYKRWVKKFPTVKHVARAKLQVILKMWEGLGYYTRARNIHKCSQTIVSEFNSSFPETREELRRLPGFGPYTTGAVLSIAFNKREPIIDANVRRVIMRILAIKGLADVSQDLKISEFLGDVMPSAGMSDFNQGLMELGALVCRSKSPLCLQCPLNNQCKAYREGIQEIIPTPKRVVIQTIDVAIAVIKRNDKYFIQKRRKGGLFADLWEFPGGKFEKGESPIEALKREIKEEIGVELGGVKKFFTATHYFTQFKANLHVFKCELKGNPVTLLESKWVPLPQLITYPMPSGSAKIVKQLQENS